MMKFQCRLLAHGVNLLEELIVFQPRKHKQRMGMEVFGARSRHDIDFKAIWLRKSVLFKIGSFRINLLQLCGVRRRSGRVVECTGLENRRR